MTISKEAIETLELYNWRERQGAGKCRGAYGGPHGRQSHFISGHPEQYQGTGHDPVTERRVDLTKPLTRLRTDDYRSAAVVQGVSTAEMLKLNRTTLVEKCAGWD
jgi:hypothetical protein